MTHKDNPTKSATPQKKSNLFPFGSPSRRAFLLVLLLLVLCGISLFYILIQRQPHVSMLQANIYQDGVLLQTIDLQTVSEPYTFVVEAKDGGRNTISVRLGGIGICDADCPDKLCVKMGYADSSLLPIICLPHSLVIEVKETEENSVDGVTY